MEWDAWICHLKQVCCCWFLAGKQGHLYLLGLVEKWAIEWIVVFFFTGKRINWKAELNKKTFALFFMKACTYTINYKSCRVKLWMLKLFSWIRSRAIVHVKIADIITGSLLLCKFLQSNLFNTVFGVSELIWKLSKRKKTSSGPVGCLSRGKQCSILPPPARDAALYPKEAWRGILLFFPCAGHWWGCASQILDSVLGPSW